MLSCSSEVAKHRFVGFPRCFETVIPTSDFAYNQGRFALASFWRAFSCGSKCVPHNSTTLHAVPLFSRFAICSYKPILPRPPVLLSRFFATQSSATKKKKKKGKKKGDHIVFCNKIPVSRSHLRQENDFSTTRVPLHPFQRKEITDFADGSKDSAKSPQQHSSEETADGSRPAKPHEVRQIVLGKPKHVHSPSKLIQKGLREQRLPGADTVAASIREFSADDISGSVRTELQTLSGHSELFGAKGTYDKDYYKAFFRDRDRQLDGKKEQVKKLLQTHAEELSAERRRVRVSAKRYWYSDEYKTPALDDIPLMTSNDLKRCMMNEGHSVSKGSPIKGEVWRYFLRRVVELKTQVHLRTLLRFLQPLASVRVTPDAHFKILIREIYWRRKEMRPSQKVYLLQSLARLRWRDQHTLLELHEMALAWPVLQSNFLIKACNSISKLDLASHILCRPLRMAMAVKIPFFTGRNCQAVKSVSVLELFDDSMIVEFLSRCQLHQQHFRTYCRHLQIVELYLRLLKPHVYDRLTDAVKLFLEEYRQAATQGKYGPAGGSSGTRVLQQSHTHSRSLMSESQHSKYGERSPDDAAFGRGAYTLAEILQEADSQDEDAEHPEKLRTSPQLTIDKQLVNHQYSQLQCGSSNKDSFEHLGCYLRTEGRSESRKEGKHVPQVLQTLDISDSCGSDKSEERVDSGEDFQGHGVAQAAELSDEDDEEEDTDSNGATSADVSRVLQLMGVGHVAGLQAGPFSLDIFHPETNIAIEINTPYQFYSGTRHFTSSCRWRHSLLAAMGFCLLHLPEETWHALETTEEKVDFLRNALPPQMLESSTKKPVSAVSSSS